MKIVVIVPGFGGTFYCGNCLRDSGYAASLRNAGHDAMTLPMYLPLTVDGKQANSEIPVFYGAVNIYLKQQFPFLKNMPLWIENMLNSRSVLRFAASKAGSTRAEGLEELTESMLLGENGKQSHELEELVDFLKVQKPDIVHFSNALLIGLARRVKEETGAKIICSLQDEDVWVDAMRMEYRERMWSLLSEKAADVDFFIAVSEYFGKLMQEKMRIPAEKIKIVPVGIDPSLYEMNEMPSTPAIGYVSRICHENGFHILVDAFIKIRKDGKFPGLRLLVTGGMTGDDNSFLHEQVKKLKNEGLENEMEIFNNFTLDDLKRFFKKVSLVSVPVLHGEAFGLYQIEAMASGVPVVQPALGAFPEIINKAGGGIIYQPNTPDALAEAISVLLNDPEKLNSLRINGRAGIKQKFDSRRIVEEMIRIFSSQDSAVS